MSCAMRKAFDFIVTYVKLLTSKNHWSSIFCEASDKCAFVQLQEVFLLITCEKSKELEAGRSFY